MGAEVLMLLAITVPFVTAVLVGMSDSKPNQRETVTLVGACITSMKGKVSVHQY